MLTLVKLTSPIFTWEILQKKKSKKPSNLHIKKTLSNQLGMWWQKTKKKASVIYLSLASVEVLKSSALEHWSNLVACLFFETNSGHIPSTLSLLA